MDRAITPAEIEVVRWLLDHASTGDVAAYRRHPLENLRVVDKRCNCGCSSLDFQCDGWGGASMVADALAGYSDGQQAGLILWGRGGELVLLEIYDCHPGASHRFPEISDLRRFDSPVFP